MSSLTRDDWDFSCYKKIPSSAISRIYLWEMDRDLGSGKGPFAKDPANKKWLASLSKEKTHTILPNAPVVSSSGNSHKTRGGDALAASGARFRSPGVKVALEVLRREQLEGRPTSETSGAAVLVGRAVGGTFGASITHTHTRTHTRTHTHAHTHTRSHSHLTPHLPMLRHSSRRV